MLNRDLWERLSRSPARAAPKGIDWRWVRGHVGTAGNERCDEIAVAFALQRPPDPLSGSAAGLRGRRPDRTGRHVAANAFRRIVRGQRATKAKAYSYLSVVDGVPMRHATWAECEQRVKGRSGARFKKAASAADEQAILRDWGVTLKV